MKLKSIAAVSGGYPFRGKIPESVGSSVVAVQMKDISLMDGVRWEECVETRLTGKREPVYLKEGDILVAARGGHNYAILVDDAATELGKKAVASPHFFVVSIKCDTVIPEFLTWLLNQIPVQRYFEQNAEGTLTKSIRRNIMEDIPVVLPPVNQQRAIIAVAGILREEQMLAQKLIDNGRFLSGKIAVDLYASHCNKK